MTHERVPRQAGHPGGPEDDQSLPDAREVPLYATAAEAIAAAPDPVDDEDDD